jgi:hypothetical protein
MKELVFQCPCCEEEIKVVIDGDFNIVSVLINNIEVSELEQNEILNKYGIEFG